jgi:hypothetical protein
MARSVKGKTSFKSRAKTPKIASNNGRNNPPGRKKQDMKAVPSKRELMFAAMKGD